MKRLNVVILKAVLFCYGLFGLGNSSAQGLLIDTLKNDRKVTTLNFISIVDTGRLLESITVFNGNIVIEKRFGRYDNEGIRIRSNTFPIFYDDRLCNRAVKEISYTDDTSYALGWIPLENPFSFLWYENGRIKRNFELGYDTCKLKLIDFSIFGDTVFYSNYKLVKKEEYFCWMKEGNEFELIYSNHIKRHRLYVMGKLMTETIFLDEEYLLKIDFD